MSSIVQDAPNALVQALAEYAGYHREKRNILTHFFGIPLIVFGVQVLLAHAGFVVAGMYVSALWFVTALACLYYLRLELAMGAVMAVWLLPMGYLAQMLSNAVQTAGHSGVVWGVGLFVMGWILQFIGHYFEGKKPAFVDDLIGLAIGPLFVAAELLFLCGLRRELEAKVVAIAGPTHVRVF